MGASAFGNTDRMTNPYYKRLREIVFFGPEGQVFLNRAMVNWCYDMTVPYTQLLVDVLGPPIPFERVSLPRPPPSRPQKNKLQSLNFFFLE